MIRETFFLYVSVKKTTPYCVFPLFFGLSPAAFRLANRQHDDSEDDAIIEAAEEENIKKTTSSVPPLVFGGVRERGDEQCRCWCIVVVLEMRPDDYLHHRSECRRGRNKVSSRMAVHVASDRTENE